MVEIPDQTLPETETTPTSDKTKVEPTTKQTPDLTAELPVKPVIDYKVKFSESKEEALRIREENKRLSLEKIELEAKLAKASESSFERDISIRYPDWDLLTESERTIVKNQEHLSKELADIKEEKAWDKDLAKAKFKYPKLAGKETEFKEFCYKYPKGIDAETLAKSFLFDDVIPIKEEPKETRKGLEKPTAGPNKISTPGLSLEDIKRLREDQPQIYAKMIKENRLKVPEK